MPNLQRKVNIYYQGKKERKQKLKKTQVNYKVWREKKKAKARVYMIWLDDLYS